MIFQTLDDKKECVGIYCDNDLHFDEREFPNNLTATWGYAEHLRDKQIEYASLYLEGKKIAEDNGIHFMLVKSTRWDKDDPMKPLNKELVANGTV